MVSMQNVSQICGSERTGKSPLSFLMHNLKSGSMQLIYCSDNFCIRWAFIDLSAGPFTWGPAVGGEGVRTELSLPNVEKTIGAVSGTTVPSFYNLDKSFFLLNCVVVSLVIRWFLLSID